MSNNGLTHDQARAVKLLEEFGPDVAEAARCAWSAGREYFPSTHIVLNDAARAVFAKANRDARAPDPIPTSDAQLVSGREDEQ
jgi:hypothetical protein